MYKPAWMRTWIILAVALPLDFQGAPQGYHYTSAKGRIVYGDKIISAGGLGVLAASRAEVYLERKFVLDWLISIDYTLDSIDGFVENGTSIGTGTDSNATELSDILNANWIDTPNIFQIKQSLFNDNRGYIYIGRSGTN